MERTTIARTRTSIWTAIELLKKTGLGGSMTKERDIWLAKRNVWRRKDKNPPPGVTYIPTSNRKAYLGITVWFGPTPDLEQLMTEILHVAFVWRVFKLAMEQYLAKKAK